MKQKHIFLVFHNFGLGGVQRRMADLANFISHSSDYKNYVCHILLREKTKFTFEHYLEKNKNQIRIHYPPKLPRIPLIWRFKNLVYGFYLVKQIFVYSPVSALVFLQFSLPFLVFAKLLLFWKKFNLVLSQDNILSLYNKSEHVSKVFSRRVIKYLYYFCDQIIVQTEYAKKDLVKNYFISAAKIKVIQNWAIGDFSQYKKQKRQYDFIYCGRFVPQKNLSLMMRMMLMVVRESPNAKLLLIGNGSDENFLKALVRKLSLEKNVSFLSANYDVYLYLSQAKVFLLTSDFEGHPMVLLEAMALGVVPLLIKYPGASEYIKNGETGFIVKNKQEMSQRGLDLLKNKKLWQQISQAVRKTVGQENGDNLIRETLKLLG